MLPTAPGPGEFNRHEPVPGYRTVELLGRGGCGEVWKAIAPGGLAKAVKIVYGDGEASHARAEERALARLRDVRHPMLLSIERIEVSHGNLIVVTELADCSLKQRFAEARNNGGDGLPEGELLGYMGDVAEALDYLYEKFSLQHLDVKPENILLVSGRAKLGDFGLVKSLYERSVSLVGGLTPTYAPPELFEGRPTRHSDQYSLALVYMQMLTGVLPFTANNAAQLAEQHLRGVPDLWALPRHQSTVVARALSKDPKQRYESCQAMVAALRESSRSSQAGKGRTQPAGRTPASGPATTPDSAVRSQPRPEEHTAHLNIAEQVPTDSHQPAAAETAVDHRTPATAATSGTRNKSTTDFETCPPTLLVAVGGTGVQVVSRVVDRLRDHYGPVEAWPPVRVLALDSSGRELSARFTDDVLERVQVVPIPLASPETYGARAGDYLSWISRRWLYNIPRDQTTDGFRPLGRLALMTHAARVREEIQTAVSHLSQLAGELSSSAEEPARVEAVPRVLVVSSLCGGTGSGAMIDVTYAVRSELKRRGQSDENVHGVLLCSTPRSNADRDKARSSAWATLSELFHFSRSGSFYPGERALGADPFHGDNATFSRRHLLHLGDQLSQSEWQHSTEHVADFIYCTSFTPAREAVEGADSGSPTEARTFGALALGADRTAIISQSVARAANDVIGLWRTGHVTGNPDQSGVPSSGTAVITIRQTDNSASEELLQNVQSHLKECGFHFEQLLEDAMDAVEQLTGSTPDDYIAGLVDNLLDATRKAKGTSRVESILATMDDVIAREQDLSDNGTSDSLYEQVVARLLGQSRGRSREVLSRIRGMVDQPAIRVEGARLHALALRDSLSSMQGQVRLQCSEVTKAAAAIGLKAREPDQLNQQTSRFSRWSFRREDPDARLRVILSEYGAKRLEESLFRTVVKVIRTTDAEVTTQIEQLDRLGRQLSQLSVGQLFDSTEAAREDSEPAGRPAAMMQFQQMLRNQLGRCRQEIARRVETTIDRQLLNGETGLQRFLDPEEDQPQVLSRPLMRMARWTVLDAVRDIASRLIDGGPEGRQPADCPAIAELIGQGFRDLDSGYPAAGHATPGSAAGGTPTAGAASVVNRLLIVPEAVNIDRLQQLVDQETPGVTIVGGRKSDVMLCSVRRYRPLVAIADEIICGTAVYRELGERLRTRSDISWSPFTGTAAAARQETAGIPEIGLSTAPLGTAILGNEA